MSRVPQVFTRRMSVFTLLLCVGVCAATMMAFTGFGSAVAATGKTATSKTCYKTGKYKGKTVRVPIACPKPKPVKKCYLTSKYKGKIHKVEIDCPKPKKKPTPSGGSTGSTGSGSGGGNTGSGGGNTGSNTGSGSGNSANIGTVGKDGFNWNETAAVCDDGSTPTFDGQAEIDCADGSLAYCTNGELIVDPFSSNPVCLVATSTIACDDGSNVGDGGTDSYGNGLCNDGTYPLGVPTGVCDDGSTPGSNYNGPQAGGADVYGNLLCADDTYPAGE